MAINTTEINLTTTPAAVISTATTWASVGGARDYGSAQNLSVFNATTAQTIYISGSSSTAATGFPVLSSGYYFANLNPGDKLWAFTTASTGRIVVQVN